MRPAKTAETRTALSARIGAYFTERRLRFWREYLTAYLMLAPALVLILAFGIFPVIFALYVSVHRWRIVRSDYIGLENYVDAVGNVTYVVLFFLGLLALYGAYAGLKRLRGNLQEEGRIHWLLALPGLVHSAAVLALLRYGWFQLPEFLDIADKLRGQEKTRELFVQLLGEAFRAPTVQPAWRLFIVLLIASLIAGSVALLLLRNARGAEIQGRFVLVWLGLELGSGLLWFTYSQVKLAYEAALETGADPGIWPQFITITAGVILLLAAWQIWRRAEKAPSNWRFGALVLAALAMLVGGWVLIGEIPTIIAQGDKDLWNGLKVTVFFSLGTVPFQLMFAIFLAVLLFQRLKGSEFFRMVFFIPYVTPFIASAAIFRQLFANRDTAPANLIIRRLGGEGLGWLQESKGVMTIIGERLGVAVPGWLAGPSLALVVIIIHAVWTYVGYDTIIYLAGLANIPQELNEAAEIDGAGKWQVFRHITFPLLSPTTYFLSLIAIIGTFKAFATLWVFRESLALGTTDTFSIVIFTEFFEKLRYGYASSLAFVLFIIIIALTLVNNRVQGSRVFYG